MFSNTSRKGRNFSKPVWKRQKKFLTPSGKRLEILPNLPERVENNTESVWKKTRKVFKPTWKKQKI
jgi:hypothetical protein